MTVPLGPSRRIGGTNVNGTDGNLSRFNRANGMVSVVGHQYPVKMGRAAMQIDWMSRDELSQAVPPAFTFHVGSQLMMAVLAAKEAAA